MQESARASGFLGLAAPMRLLRHSCQTLIANPKTTSGDLRCADVLAASDDGRLDVMAAMTRVTFDIEDRERHTASL
jgi:hypothetical protein